LEYRDIAKVSLKFLKLDGSLYPPFWEGIMANRLDSNIFHQGVHWEEQVEELAMGGVALSEAPVSDPCRGPHDVEQAVWHGLQCASGYHFSTLIVRRLQDGVCLQGVLEAEDATCLQDVYSLVKSIACVDRVLTQFVVRESRMVHNS
jgi:hypothetical protein